MLKNTVTMFPQFIYLSKHQKGNSTPPLGIHVMFECTFNFRVWKAQVLSRWNRWLSLHTRDEGSIKKSENPEFRTPINWGTPGNLDDLMRGSSDAQSLKGSGREFRNRNCCQPLNHLSETSAHQCFVLQLKPPFFDSFWHVATSQGMHTLYIRSKAGKLEKMTSSLGIPRDLGFPSVSVQMI